MVYLPAAMAKLLPAGSGLHMSVPSPTRGHERGQDEQGAHQVGSIYIYVCYSTSVAFVPSDEGVVQPSL